MRPSIASPRSPRRKRRSNVRASTSDTLSCARRRTGSSPRAISCRPAITRSEEHKTELQTLKRIADADFCSKKKNTTEQEKEQNDTNDYQQKKSNTREATTKENTNLRNI